MGFVLTLLYIALSLLSPDALPEGFQDIHILEIVVVFVFLASLPVMRHSRVFRLRETYFISTLVLAAFLSILGTGWIGGAFSKTAGFLPVIAAYYFLVINCTSLTRLKILVAVLFLVIADVLVHGMLADHAGTLISPYIYREHEIVRYRGRGVIADPNDLAQVIVTLIALLFLRWKKGAFAANFFLTLVPAGFLCFGVYLTHSRGALLALVLMTLFGLKDRLGVIRSVILTGLLCAALIAFNATGGRNLNEDDGDRIGLWRTALTTFKTHPITGVGMDMFGDYSDNGLTAHNSYVLCLAELGLFGYLAWMGTIVTSWSGVGAIAARRPTAEVEPADLPLAPHPADRERVALKPRPPVLSPRTVQPAAPRMQLPDPMMEENGSKAADASAMVTAAHVIRTALVGVLVSAFFISRTYALILYIIFGMSAALQVMYQRTTGEKSPDIPLLKRISLATVCSVLFLYLFVRIRGSH